MKNNNQFLKTKPNQEFNYLHENSNKGRGLEKSNVYDSSSRFKSSNSNKKQTVKTFIICDQDFPDLIKNSNTPLDSPSNNYKDIITSCQHSNIDNSEKNTVPPGHIEISNINNKICFKQGPLTPSQIKVNNLNHYNEFLSGEPNYIMYNAINYMKKNWESYRKDYDSVYGEGAYEEKFVYKNENEYEFDEDNHTESDIDSEDENDIMDQWEKERDYLV
jgi:hypothetical protein